MSDVPGLTARMAACAIVEEVLTSFRALDDCFSQDHPHIALKTLDARDRGLARSIATVTLRRQGTLRLALASLMQQGLRGPAKRLEWILLVAGAQILFMDVPDHAAVDLAVRATRLVPKCVSFAGLVNGVLRNLIRQQEVLSVPADPMADIPPWLASRWIAAYGTQKSWQIARALAHEPTLDLSVRANAAQWAERLGGIVLPTGSVRLETHEDIASLEGYAEGQWWVQDTAAALPARLLQPSTGQAIADLCAAPGGKTAQLALAGANVTAIDRSAKRLERLKINLGRLDLAVTTQACDVLTFQGGPFDGVLLDAPCSATGTIRRHPDVAWVRQETDIAALTKIQKAMLNHAAELVKPGGLLVYAVCSLEPEEGEDQIAGFLARHTDFARCPISADEIGGLAECINANGELRTLPCHMMGDDQSRENSRQENFRMAGMDGFFAARLQRREA